MSASQLANEAGQGEEPSTEERVSVEDRVVCLEELRKATVKMSKKEK